MSCRIMLIKKTEMAKIVAAAGFTLKQENMNARLIRVTASNVIKKCTAPKRCQADAPLKTPMIWSSGNTTKSPPDGKKALASSTLNTPSDSTRIKEKMAAASHFKNRSRRREIGRHKIILKVPSSASLATMSPPTSETYKGSRK